MLFTALGIVPIVLITSCCLKKLLQHLEAKINTFYEFLVQNLSRAWFSDSSALFEINCIQLVIELV